MQGLILLRVMISLLIIGPLVFLFLNWSLESKFFLIPQGRPRIAIFYNRSGYRDPP